ncbi:hypothetical protein L2D14_16245 [Thalassospiraceae bacterium LMO-JJ14]|nr:hypothetical protein L2D14_16245 [Thalassospiraceae bacterium LMO-JJ14]
MKRSAISENRIVSPSPPDETSKSPRFSALALAAIPAMMLSVIFWMMDSRSLPFPAF